MISDRVIGRLIRLASLSLLVAAGSSLALAATPESELREYIADQDELRAVYELSAAYWGSDIRAEAVAQYGASRHAVVMYKAHKVSSGLGQKLCHSALGRKERGDWVEQLVVAADGDRVVARHLAGDATPTIRFKRSEYSSLPDWNGWHVGVCAVPEANISAAYPPLPDASSVRVATYDVGKQLYASGMGNKALDRFKSLKSDTQLYPNALLFIVAILQDNYPGIAKSLRESHVNLSKADDLDALEAYARSSLKYNYLDEAAKSALRCTELGKKCNYIEVQED